MTIRALTVALLVLLAAVVYGAAPRMWDGMQLATGWGLPHRAGPPLLIIGHHGDPDAFVENTVESIVAAAALHPDGIEMDVHQSASGSWYVIHDPTLDRTTNAHGSISELPDDQIDAAVIDAGLGFNEDQAGRLHVPRLVDVLARLTAFRGTIYLDLQHAESGDPASLVDLTEGRRVAIICRSSAEAVAIKARDQAVETLLSVAFPASAEVDGLIGDASLHASQRLMDEWTLPLTVYVEEDQFNRDESDLLRLAWATGAKAFITNHLEAALAIRDILAQAGSQ
jgi:glycerophosphoryl diester phosphodiesterase